MIGEALRKHIRAEIRASRNRLKKKINTANFIIKLFGSDIEKDKMFSEFLAAE